MLSLSSNFCVVFYFVIATFGFFVQSGTACDIKDCPSVPKHYDELGCKPIKKNGDCCISSFDCPDLVNRNNTNCYYKNKVFVPGQVLENFEHPDTCETKCYCRVDRNGGPSEMYCSRARCTDKIPTNQKVNYCLRQYDSKNCCSTGTVCDDDITKLASCEFEGRTYKEGERFYPKNHCYKCFCSKGFNNKTSVVQNKDCHKIDCGMALTKTRRLIEGCIPVYIKTDECCPVGWRCPGERHMKVSPAKTDSTPKCKFGNMALKVGESLDLSQSHDCTCKTPPMLHCIQKY